MATNTTTSKKTTREWWEGMINGIGNKDLLFRKGKRVNLKS